MRIEHIPGEAGGLRLLPVTLNYVDQRVEPGNRNHALFDAALQFRDAGYPLQEALAQLLRCAVTRDGLSEREAIDSINSAYNHGPRDPIGNGWPRPGWNGDFRGFRTPARPPAQPVYRKIEIEAESHLPPPLAKADEAAILYLEQFPPRAFISIGYGYEKRAKGKPGRSITGGKVRQRETWIADIKEHGLDGVFPPPRSGPDGIFARVNPVKAGSEGDSDEDVDSWRYALIESDEDSLEVQWAALQKVGLPIRSATYSGDRSINVVFIIDAPDAAVYAERYQILKNFCEQALSLDLDKNNKNPSRYTRLAGARRQLRDHDTNQKRLGPDGKPIIVEQTLLVVNVPGLEWDEWLKTLPIETPEEEDLSWLTPRKVPELTTVQPPQILEGVLYQSCKLVLMGSSKAFKTWTLMDMAYCIGNGLPWWGIPTQKTAVVYFDFEVLDYDFRWRMEQIAAAHGQAETTALDLVERIGLRGETLIAAHWEKVHNHICALGAGAVFCDPTYKLLRPGGDENATGDIALVTAIFDRLTTATGASMIYAQHFSKGNQARKESIDRGAGSGVWARDADSIPKSRWCPPGQKRCRPRHRA